MIVVLITGYVVYTLRIRIRISHRIELEHLSCLGGFLAVFYDNMMPGKLRETLGLPLMWME